MQTRRELLRRAALLSGAAGLSGGLLPVIERALAVDPEPGSSYLDAEHVVILMQENRSFDHMFGTLRGVRGFADPRAVRLADGAPAWVQTDAAGESHVPFRLDLARTNATWAGGLPHTWPDQIDAHHEGGHDRWLDAKRPRSKANAALPLTLGHLTREDLPFYYALADAFTVCDQHFCSVLAGTTSNRLHLWTGTSRAAQSSDSPAHLRNEDADHDTPVGWTTFPERLQDLGVSWRVYQNEVSIPTGLTDEEDAWLASFGDNPLEYFRQYEVRFAASHGAHLERRATALAAEVAALEKAGGEALEEARAALAHVEAQRARWSPERREARSARAKELHARAFCTNDEDPGQRELASVPLQEGEVERRIQVPAGDLLARFRADCEAGALPAVSWLVPPQRLSDHPSSALFGPWYVAEVLDILTRDPALWKKTIVLVTYDENDGYFDHVPPFVAPDPRRPETGRASAGIDTGLEFVELAQDARGRPAGQAREGPIGLGYRVPLIVASPWSRGGCVCSQVVDHTSSLRLLETWLSHRLGRPVREPNISAWRRTVCGDLAPAFQAAPVAGKPELGFPPRDAFFRAVHAARGRPPVARPEPLTPAEVGAARRDPQAFARRPRQEPGVRPSSPLPYELAADGALSPDRARLVLRLEARTARFGARSDGAPFVAYARLAPGRLQPRHYAVTAGDRLEDAFALPDFEGGRYDLAVHGPNGFFRALRGDAQDALEVGLEEADLDPPRAIVLLTNRHATERLTVRVVDEAYGEAAQERALGPGETARVILDVGTTSGWYALGVSIAGQAAFARTYAGRIETGRWSQTDPAMGKG